jgi:hypothetical protein
MKNMSHILQATILVGEPQRKMNEDHPDERKITEHSTAAFS